MGRMPQRSVEPAELGTLDRRRLSALIGVAPMNRDSGRQHGTRSTQGGRNKGRREGTLTR